MTGESFTSNLPNIIIIFKNKFILLFYLFIVSDCVGVFIAVHRLFSSGGERGLLFLAVRGLLIAVASPVAEPGL